MVAALCGGATVGHASFRGHNWGETREQVIAAEGEDLLQPQVLPDVDGYSELHWLAYQRSLGGYPAYVGYSFDKPLRIITRDSDEPGKLVLAGYYARGSSDLFDNWKALADAKYGADARAVRNDDFVKKLEWETSTTMIVLTALFSGTDSIVGYKTETIKLVPVYEVSLRYYDKQFWREHGLFKPSEKSEPEDAPAGTEKGGEDDVGER